MQGRESTFRHMIANLAQLQSGETVLDVGCGTGTLALIAKEYVGETGCIAGIDPSKSLLAGACHKATRAGLSINFQQGGIEQIPFPDQTFDVVLSTFMMHHVPDDIKHQGVTEIARVLKTGGRLLVVDFQSSEEHQGCSLPFDTEMGIQNFPAFLQSEGFEHLTTGNIPFRIRSLSAGHKHYGFVSARKGEDRTRESYPG
ncbi:class I SAM-dependent methyltransferase [Dictyobacter formicarum]|uniref:Methyltransferase domain-containing protein n=1 Tax=Dictyobacter formicarum TaxID=2778368 RepID=A0ABQ3VD59_9CHLR|nr:class I SAM-dependent methyltransferase [Dictyobacter formicarum]GHO84014.1 hypothetical protein KSZ_20200 [Dictyobacter formicarum]